MYAAWAVGAPTCAMLLQHQAASCKAVAWSGGRFRDLAMRWRRARQVQSKAESKGTSPLYYATGSRVPVLRRRSFAALDLT